MTAAGSGSASSAMGPTIPRYGTADVGMIVPDVLRHLTGHAPRLLPIPHGTRGVVVLVVDGLGRRLLDRHPDVAPFLASASGPTLDAPFPTTTATSLTSIGTGLHPGAHGITGYSVAVEHDDRPLIVLTWSWERHDAALDARDEVIPEHLQPRPTLFERATADGIAAVTVLRPEFATSGLTRAALRGGRVVPATGREATVAAAIDAVATPGGPTMVYAHHGDLDTLGHLAGPSSDAWCTELAAIDALLERTASDLPRDVALVVTADHGMVHVPEDGYVEVADHPQLLAGVRVLTGDARARQLHVRPGAADEVLEAWRGFCGARAHVRTRDDAIAAGWFGPSVEPDVRPRIGDVVVSAIPPDVGWVHRDHDLFGGRVPGMHGAMTPDEVEVPALVLTS